MKKYFIRAAIISGIIILSVIIKTQDSVAFNAENQIIESLILTSALHEPIIIMNDDNFTDYGFPGSGTAGEPYIIENYNITSTSDRAISISETTKYFIIRNCYLEAAISGLYIYGIVDGSPLIVNNTVENNIYGIDLWNSFEIDVINNTCRYNSEYGIRLDHVHESTVTNNTSSFNNAYGIYQWDSSNSTFTENTCYDNDMRGIYLQDCFNASVVNNTCNGNNWDGIYLLSSYSITLENNTCIDNHNGINLHNTFESYVINNTCSYSKYEGYGIYLEGSVYIEIANNTCIDNYNSGIYTIDSQGLNITNNICDINRQGIKLVDSLEVYIYGNNCSDVLYGIHIDYCSTTYIVDNSLVGNRYGILSTYSPGTIIRNNSLFDTGLSIFEETLVDYLSYIVENNWVNNKKLGFIKSQSYSVITDISYGQLICVNCANLEIYELEIINTTYGIFLIHCNNITVRDCTFIDNYHGTYVLHSPFTSLTNNYCTENGIGITLWFSSSSTITDNDCIKNDVGISIHSSPLATLIGNNCTSTTGIGTGISLYHSYGATASQNTCSNNGDGFYIYSYTDVTLDNNTCNANSDDGIECSHVAIATFTNCVLINNGYKGIGILASDYNTITGNLFQNNSYGLWIYACDSCIVLDNHFIENIDFGVYIEEGSTNNTIHHNTFIDNNLNGHYFGNGQAYDAGTNNTWYDKVTKEGNFWNTWDSKKPFLIDGPANSEDIYPLNDEMKRISYPTIIAIPVILFVTILHKYNMKKKSRD